MRKSGVLMHLASLPSEYGVGTMGAEARKFADFLSDAGQQYWQLLPICPTSYGDSPYQSFSTFAGNPYFIDLDLLAAEGLLDKKEYVSVNWGDDRAFCTNFAVDFAKNLRRCYVHTIDITGM